MNLSSLRPRGQTFALCFIAVAALSSSSEIRAENMDGALAKAFRNNSSLNAQRASTRASEEGPATAIAAYRPSIGMSLDAGAYGSRSPASRFLLSRNSFVNAQDKSVSLSIEQTLYAGGRLDAGLVIAEAGLEGARALLRNAEQITLLRAAEAYADVFRDRAVLEYRISAIDVLAEQLRQAEELFILGELTDTDVSHVRVRIAGGQADRAAAEAALAGGVARYAQIVGDRPNALAAPKFPERLAPRALQAATDEGLRAHPSIAAAAAILRAAEQEINFVRGELYPSVSVLGTVGRTWEGRVLDAGAPTTDSYGVYARMNVPLYERGGSTYPRLRAAKERASQRSIELMNAREEVRASVIGWHANLNAAKLQIKAAKAQIEAAEAALRGAVAELRVGRRTMLDVLITNQELLTSRLALVGAERDEVVSGYALLAAVGRMSAERLSLKVSPPDARAFYANEMQKLRR